MKLEQPKPVQIERTRYKPEIVDREVKREGIVYVFCKGGPSVLLVICHIKATSSLTVLTQGWEIDSPNRKWIPIAKDVGDWEYSVLTFPPEAHEPFLIDLTIRGDRRLWLSDFLYGAMTMVTPRARAVIEDLDPDMNYFFLVKIFDRDSGELVSD